MIQHINIVNVGCFYRSVNTSIILYADETLLLAPSVHSLQTLLSSCEAKLRQLDLAINANKNVGYVSELVPVATLNVLR